MVCYSLNTESGKMRKLARGKRAEKRNHADGKENCAEPDSSNTAIIEIMNLEEYKELEDNLVHRKNFSRSLEMIRYCKLEKFDCCLQGTMRVPAAEKRKAVSFGYYLTEDRLLFVEKGQGLQTRVEKIKDNLYEGGTLLTFLLVLFESILEEDFFYLQELEDHMGKLEEELIKEIPENFDETVMGYRKRFAVFHSYYQQLMDIGELMQDKMGQELLTEEEMAWQHYADRAERFYNHTEMLREYLIQIRELYQSIIAERQNRVMSFLTMITTIFFPLTLIAGWYGMNFPHMPEFEWEFGYPLIIGISIGILVAEIFYIKRKKML